MSVKLTHDDELPPLNPGEERHAIWDGDRQRWLTYRTVFRGTADGDGPPADEPHVITPE